MPILQALNYILRWGSYYWLLPTIADYSSVSILKYCVCRRLFFVCFLIIQDPHIWLFLQFFSPRSMGYYYKISVRYNMTQLHFWLLHVYAWYSTWMRTHGYKFWDMIRTQWCVDVWLCIAKVKIKLNMSQMFMCWYQKTKKYLHLVFKSTLLSLGSSLCTVITGV